MKKKTYSYNPITGEMDMVGNGADITPVTDEDIEALFPHS